MNDRYKEYLKSGEWAYTKKQKIRSVGGCCEGCGENKDLDVHHETYERIGMELLTDLKAYCRECHDKAHGKVRHSEWNKYLTNKTDNKPKEKRLKDVELEMLIRAI